MCINVHWGIMHESTNNPYLKMHQKKDINIKTQYRSLIPASIILGNNKQGFIMCDF